MIGPIFPSYFDSQRCFSNQIISDQISCFSVNGYFKMIFQTDKKKFDDKKKDTYKCQKHSLRTFTLFYKGHLINVVNVHVCTSCILKDS